MKSLGLFLILVHLHGTFCIYKTSNSSQKVSNNPAVWTESGLFGSILEEWTLGHSNHRSERILRLPSTSGYYISERYDNEVPTKEKWSQEYNAPVEKISYRPPSSQYQAKPSAPIENNKRKEISETDLYLLGAIEKLVYRVDFMEKRLKKAEEMIYYLQAGKNKNPDPCPANFTRAGKNCYYFENKKIADWKIASDLCKGRGSTLAEMETIEENQDIVSYIQANAPFRGHDYWTGGLNPGLLWIWSNSARPVANGKMGESQPSKNSTLSAYNPVDIKGNGRCLKLAYNPALRTYAYQGANCAVDHYFICEIPDKTSSNNINRISKDLSLD